MTTNNTTNSLIQELEELKSSFVLPEWARIGHFVIDRCIQRVRQHQAEPPQDVVERVSAAILYTLKYRLYVSSKGLQEGEYNIDGNIFIDEIAKAAIAAMGESTAQVGSTPTSPATDTLIDKLEAIRLDWKNDYQQEKVYAMDYIIPIVAEAMRPSEITVVDTAKERCIADDQWAIDAFYEGYEKAQADWKANGFSGLKPIIGGIRSLLAAVNAPKREYGYHIERDVNGYETLILHAIGERDEEEKWLRHDIYEGIKKRLKIAIGGLRSIAYGKAETWPDCSPQKVAKQALSDCGEEKNTEIEDREGK